MSIFIMLAALLLLQAPGSCGEFGLPAAGPEAPAAAAPARAGGEPARQGGAQAEMGPFFARLDSIGLTTDEIRTVSANIEVFFKGAGGAGNAEYGFMADNLYIPQSMREGTSGRVRFELRPDEISTLIHEYTHAAMDVRASEKAAPGTSPRIHYDCVAAIRADLRSSAYFYSHSWMKADEVAGHFMGAALGRVFEVVDEIVMYNTFPSMAGSRAASMEEAEALGGRLILPDPAKTSPGTFEHTLAQEVVFGRSSVYDSARFQASQLSASALIQWEERQNVKYDMYRGVLGLKPPANKTELLARLNSADNPWIKWVRAKVAESRRKSAAGR